MSARLPLLVVALVSAVGLVAAATLLPQAIVGPLRSDVFSLVDALGVTADWGDLGQVANAILFAPLGGALAIAGGRRWWWAAIPGAVLLSLTVEWSQRSNPGRVPDLADVGWNSLGGTLAAVLVGGAFAVVRAVGVVRRRAASPSPAARRRAVR